MKTSKIFSHIVELDKHELLGAEVGDTLQIIILYICRRKFENMAWYYLTTKDAVTVTLHHSIILMVLH